MAAANPAKTLQDEVICHICLEYFKDPVSLDCDHSFCRACITQCWGGFHTDISCPQCREIFPQRNLRLNRQLRNIVEAARELRLQPEPESLCEKHREPLKLFCKEDEILICLVCDRSKEHRVHTVIPTEEAAEEFQVGNNQLFVKPDEGPPLLCPSPLPPSPKPINTMSVVLLSLGLREQKDVAGDVLLAHIPFIIFLQSSSPRQELRELHCTLLHEMQEGTGVMLPSYGETHGRICPTGLRDKSLRAVCWAVKDSPRGRHCWEVEVGDALFWAVGVVRESVGRKGWISCSSGGGIWAVQWCRGRFQVLTSLVTSLPLSRIPSRIWVCLDCDQGQVTFIDAGGREGEYPTGVLKSTSLASYTLAFSCGLAITLSL
uniref:Uncharacterized protein n=1 Tax=Gopherus evgoodei TaxID=1825980 RepID=A0A8C4Y6M6_9SAUR